MVSSNMLTFNSDLFGVHRLSSSYPKQCGNIYLIWPNYRCVGHFQTWRKGRMLCFVCVSPSSRWWSRLLVHTGWKVLLRLTTSSWKLDCGNSVSMTIHSTKIITPSGIWVVGTYSLTMPDLCGSGCHLVSINV